MDLIVLPFHDWKKNETEGLRNRDGHLLGHMLASDRVRRVMMVDRPISLPERWIKRRPLRCRSGEEVARSGRAILSRIDEKLFVIDISAPDLIRPLWLRRDWWDAIFRREWVAESILWGAARADLSSAERVLVSWSPLSLGVVGRLNERVFAFDADDNWCNHPQMSDARGWIERGYRKACAEADVLSCNSEKTRDFLERMGGAARTVRNGVDTELWDAERWRHEQPPPDLAALPRPWIGYAGRMAKRTNVDLIAALAARRPEWSFVMLGPVLDREWHRSLESIPNVHFLGDKHYEDLPGYVAHFDVAGIFHNVGSLENDGDPTKLYEYLALGLPVVSTPIGGVQDFADWITISDSAEEIEKTIEIVLDRKAHDPHAFDFNRQAVAGAEHSWQAKAEMMLDAYEYELERAQKRFEAGLG